MTWLEFPTYILLTGVFWVLGLAFGLSKIIKSKNPALDLLTTVFLLLGLAAIITFTIGLWISLERPPFRTLAETRLWYAVFLSTIGIILYFRWRKVPALPDVPLLNEGIAFAMLGYSLGMALLFLFLNYMNPDTFDKTLMPALQSPWFIPHVIVYIIGYAFLGFSVFVGIAGLVLYYTKNKTDNILLIADNIVYIGFAFLTFGLLFGALWAKEAWGHYWTWDPKETWAFLTWLVYLIYIHLRLKKKQSHKLALWLVTLAFIVMLIAWFGINYLPSAQSSVHVYSS
jgi:ABC-type transport system involved in cytochrome c biogenesis permease subunit